VTPSETAELRDFISGEVQGVHSRLDGVGGKVDGLHSRLDGVDGKLDGLREDQARMESLAAGQVADIESRLTKAATAREETRRDFGAFREALESTNRRLDESRDDLRRGFQEQREQTRAGFSAWGERTAALEGRVERLETGRG